MDILAVLVSRFGNSTLKVDTRVITSSVFVCVCCVQCTVCRQLPHLALRSHLRPFHFNEWRRASAYVNCV